MNGVRYRLSNGYSQRLAAFGAWAAFGIAIIMLGTGQYLIGGILAIGTAGLILIAFRGSRITEKEYSGFDIAIQWIILAVPSVFAVLLFLLAYAYFRPYAVYIALYLAVLMIFAALVARELLRRIRSDNSQ